MKDNLNAFHFIFCLIFFSFFQINIIRCYYVLPLKTAYDYDPEDSKDRTRIMHNFLTNNIYTELSIGDPIQKLSTFIKSKDYCSYIGSYLCNLENSDYNSKNSHYFTNTTPYNLIFKSFSNVSLANEKMQLPKSADNYLSDLEEANFTQFYHAPNNPYSSDNPYTCGVFGLRYKMDKNIEGEDKCINIIKSLYNNSTSIFKDNNTDNLLFSVQYKKKDSNIDGELVIGSYPHEYDPNNYKEKYYLRVDMNEEILESNNDFHTTFHEIYFFRNNKIGNNSERITIREPEDELKTIFILEQNMFMIPQKFFEYYKDNFFKVYLEDETCEIVSIDLDKYNTIICDKNKVEENQNQNFFENFPTAFYFHTGFNTTFEFTKDDLLKEKDGFLYFMMFTDTTNEENYWGIGKIFLEKYPLVFDYGNQSIGYYYDNDKNVFDFIENGIYVIIILGVNILVVVSCAFFAIIHKCTKSKVDPTIMIESFSQKNNEDLKNNLKENIKETSEENGLK